MFQTWIDFKAARNGQIDSGRQMLFHKRLSFGSDHSGGLLFFFFFVTEVAVAPNKSTSATETFFFYLLESLSPAKQESEDVGDKNS